MNMALLRLLLIMIVGGTGLLFVGLLPLYGIRRKKNPNDPKNTIPRLMGMSFLAVVIMVLLFCSGLIAMYMDDKNIGDKSIDGGKMDIINEKTEQIAVPVDENVGGDEVAEYTQITMEMARDVFAQDGDYIILDVRREEEFVQGHIPGAIHVANESIVDTRPEELPDLNQIIYVYCRSGNRSKQAAQKLAKMGYTNIIEFGGILDWSGEIEKN